MSSRGAALSFVEMTIECLLSVDGEGSRKDVQDVIFLRRFHCALRSGQRKRSVFFYDKFTTCFALRSFDWICAWESAESGSGEGEVLVQRVDLDDDPVHAEFKFSLQLIPNKGGLSVVHVESGWIRLNAKWSDIGSENRVVAELFSILRRNEYALGTVDAVVEMKFKRDTFFLIKQDQLFRTLTRELAPNELVPSERFTALEELCRGKEFLETSDFTIKADDGEVVMPRYVVALAFEYFRNLIDDEGDVYMANIPYKKSTILEVFQYAKVGVFFLDSLDGVNEALGDFIDCITQLRPLEHEALLSHIETRIFNMIANEWSSMKLDTLLRLLLFARQHTLVKVFDSLIALIVNSYYNRFMFEYSPMRNVELYRLMIDHSVTWAIRQQHEKVLHRRTQTILRCHATNGAHANANNR